MSNKIGLSAVALSAVAAIASVALPSAIAQSSLKLNAKQASLAGLPAPTETEEVVATLIVKLRASGSQLAQSQGKAYVHSLSNMNGVGVKAVRSMSESTTLVALDTPMKLSEAKAVAARLASDPAVEYAEPDVAMKPFAVPTETDFVGKQWNLYPPLTVYAGGHTPIPTPPKTTSAPATGAANLITAWDRTTGADTVVVAIIDTGIVNHPDLNNAGLMTPLTYTPGGRFLPGYDFVSTNALGLPNGTVEGAEGAGQVGREGNPADPGDALNANDRLNPLCNDNTPNQAAANGTPAANSTWHGTHSAGIVAATTNNVGMAGIGWNVKVVPIRALGRCGGAMSDVADAILWAAGGAVAGAPANAYPAKVILIGAGGKAGVACSPTLQAVVNAANAAGAVVVAAAGNEGSITGISAPANCTGVIGVTAHAINGENSTYSNIGPVGGAGPNPTISAAGGGSPTSLGFLSPIDDPTWDGYSIWSTASTGTAGPGTPTYVGRIGTSPAAAQVAGVAALIKSVAPNATPAQVTSALTTSARPFPDLTKCTPGAEYAGRCGIGMLDATRALQAAGPPVITTAPVSQTVAAGASASFVVDAVGVISYQWTRAGAAIAGANGPSYTTPVLAATDTNVGYQVVLTNSFGTTISPAAVVTVSGGASNAPSEGGGALPLWQLLLMSVLLLAGRVRVADRKQ